MKLQDAGIVLLVLLFVGWVALAEYGPSQKRDKTKTADLGGGKGVRNLF